MRVAGRHPVLLLLSALLSTVAAVLLATLTLSAQASYPYTLVDLVGIPGATSGLAVRINRAGQVLGGSFVGTSRPEPWLAFLWDNGTLIEIAGLPGGTVGKAINDRGDICGVTRVTRYGDSHAFKWTYADRRFIDLGTLGGVNSYASAINDAGDVAGYSQLADGRMHAFLYRDTMIDLGTLGGTNSYAIGINDAGLVIGAAQLPTGDAHAFIWQDGTMRDIGTIGGTYSAARDINNAGQVTGESTLASPKLAGFLYENDTMVPLGASASSASGLLLNDPGHVVGIVSLSPDAYGQGFLYVPAPNGPGSVQLFGAPPTVMTEPYAINSSDRVVGRLENSSGQRWGFLFDPAASGTKLFAVGALISPAEGWRINEAFDINDNGEIVGQGMKNDQHRPYLLRPVR